MPQQLSVDTIICLGEVNECTVQRLFPDPCPIYDMPENEAIIRRAPLHPETSLPMCPKPPCLGPGIQPCQDHYCIQLGKHGSHSNASIVILDSRVTLRLGHWHQSTHPPQISRVSSPQHSIECSCECRCENKMPPADVAYPCVHHCLGKELCCYTITPRCLVVLQFPKPCLNLSCNKWSIQVCSCSLGFITRLWELGCKMLTVGLHTVAIIAVTTHRK